MRMKSSQLHIGLLIDKSTPSEAVVSTLDLASSLSNSFHQPRKSRGVLDSGIYNRPENIVEELISFPEDNLWYSTSKFVLDEQHAIYGLWKDSQ